MTVPATVPSAEMMVRPTMLSTWDSAIDVIMESSFWFILMPCSTLEKLASWAMNCAESIGLVGSWFFIWAMSSCRKRVVVDGRRSWRPLRRRLRRVSAPDWD